MKTNWETGIDMTPLARPTIIVALFFCLAPPAWGQKYLLYTPQPAPSGQKTSAQEGILVQEVEIQKGDTLFDLSRKFSGHGMYFPQILLFNNIKNPDLIYTGNSLKVPVTRTDTPASDRAGSSPSGLSAKQKASGHKKSTRKSNDAAPASAASTELSLSDLNNVEAKKHKTTRGSRKSKTSLPQKSPTPTATNKTSAAAKDAAGDQLYLAAVKAFQQDDCRTALGLFDRYLADNSASPLAADANLYKAECYLKLSAH